MGAATNAVEFAIAYVPLLRALFDGETSVTVDDSVNSQRASSSPDYIYLGHFEGPEIPLAMQGGANLPRREDVTVQLHIEVIRKPATSLEAAARAAEIAAKVQAMHAADPRLKQASVDGLLSVLITGKRFTWGYADDGAATAELIYNLSVSSMLR